MRIEKVYGRIKRRLGSRRRRPGRRRRRLRRHGGRQWRRAYRKPFGNWQSDRIRFIQIEFGGLKDETLIIVRKSKNKKIKENKYVRDAFNFIFFSAALDEDFYCILFVG